MSAFASAAVRAVREVTHYEGHHLRALLTIRGFDLSHSGHSGLGRLAQYYHELSPEAIDHYHTHLAEDIEKTIDTLNEYEEDLGEQHQSIGALYGEYDQKRRNLKEELRAVQRMHNISTYGLRHLENVDELEFGNFPQDTRQIFEVIDSGIDVDSDTLQNPTTDFGLLEREAEEMINRFGVWTVINSGYHPIFQDIDTEIGDGSEETFDALHSELEEKKIDSEQELEALQQEYDAIEFALQICGEKIAEICYYETSHCEYRQDTQSIHAYG